MFELVLGVVLAVLFALAYLALSRLWNEDDNALGPGPNVSLRPVDGSAIASGLPPRQLNEPNSNNEPRQD